MSISAAPAYDSTVIANDFSALSSVRSISTSPMKAFESKTPAQIGKQNFQVVGVESQIKTAVSQVFDAHRKAVKTHGLAGAESGKSANILNPAKDGMLMATAAVVPAFALVASALAIASVLNYANADRKSLGKQKTLRAQLEQEVRSAGYKSRDIFDVNWGKTGYHVPSVSNDEPKLSLEEFEFLSKPPEQNYGVQILLGQQAQVKSVKAANRNRAIKGVPLSHDSVDLANEMDLKRLNDKKVIEFNLPGQHI